MQVLWARRQAGSSGVGAWLDSSHPIFALAFPTAWKPDSSFLLNPTLLEVPIMTSVSPSDLRTVAPSSAEAQRPKARDCRGPEGHLHRGKRLPRCLQMKGHQGKLSYWPPHPQGSSGRVNVSLECSVTGGEGDKCQKHPGERKLGWETGKVPEWEKSLRGEKDRFAQAVLTVTCPF